MEAKIPSTMFISLVARRLGTQNCRYSHFFKKVLKMQWQSMWKSHQNKSRLQTKSKSWSYQTLSNSTLKARKISMSILQRMDGKCARTSGAWTQMVLIHQFANNELQWSMLKLLLLSLLAQHKHHHPWSKWRKRHQLLKVRFQMCNLKRNQLDLNSQHLWQDKNPWLRKLKWQVW